MKRNHIPFLFFMHTRPDFSLSLKMKSVLILVLVLNIVCTPKKDRSQTVQKNDMAGAIKDTLIDTNSIEEESFEEQFIKKDTTPENPKPLEKQLLSKMIQHYFELNPSCAYEKKEVGEITINGVLYNGFSTGLTQLLTGYHAGCGDTMPGISDAFAWLLNKTDNGNENQPISLLIKEVSGVKPFSKVKEFWYIRLEFVEWAIQNLIPEPDSTVFDVTCKQIYTTLFSGICRILYQSLLWLESVDGRFENEYSIYSKMFRTGNQHQGLDGTTYLQEIYKNIHFKYVSDNSYFNEPEAIGFWLRRYWDGSYIQLKKALLYILENYDSSILNDEYLKKYASNVSKDLITPEWLHFSSPDMTIELPHFTYSCEYEKTEWDTLDTVYLDMSSFEGCGSGHMDTIQLFKNRNIKSAKIFHQGTRAFYFNDEGKGGMWTDSSVSESNSEEVELQPADKNRNVFINKDIFTEKDIKWENFSKRDSSNIDSILSEAKYRSYQLLPLTEMIKITWKRSDTDEVYQKCIVLQFGYGD